MSESSSKFVVVVPNSSERVATVEVTEIGLVVRELAPDQWAASTHPERDQHASFLRATDIHWRNRLKAPIGTFATVEPFLFAFETTNFTAGPLLLSIGLSGLLPPTADAEVTHCVSLQVMDSQGNLIARLSLNGFLPAGEKIARRTLVVENISSGVIVAE